MTNATIFETNSTSHDQIKTEKCNLTTNSTDKEVQNCALISLQAQINHCSNNNSSNSTDCESIIAPQSKSNETQGVNTDTILKYVYKKGDKAEIPIKDKAYFKNSLRRKRSPVEVHNRSPLPSKFQKPVVVNYETSHGPGQAQSLAPLRFTGNNALGANFKIETLHDNIDAKKEEDIARKLKIDSAEIVNPNRLGNDYKQNDDKGKPIENDSSDDSSDSSDERGDYKNRQPQNDDVNSTERDDYQKQNPQGSQESAESDDYKEPKTDSERTYSAERTNYDKNSSQESDNSSEHEEYKNKQSSAEGDNSEERSTYKDIPSNREREESNGRAHYKQNEFSNKRGDSGEDNSSAESSESNPRTNARYSSRSKNSNENSGSNESKNSESSSAESQESVERGDSNKKKNEQHNHDSSSYETPHQDNAKYKKPESSAPKYLESSSNENSDESREIKKEDENLNADKKDNVKGSPIPLRDIDLSDFSYERIQVDGSGKVQPQKDTFEPANPKTAVEILPLTTATPNFESKGHRSLNSITDYTAIAKPKINKNDNKLIQIDDVEVKPVVEINPENDNDSSEESKKSNVSEEVESLESILGVKEPENDDSQSDKLIEQKAQDGDVKQEFERIPLNYNHAQKNEKKEHPVSESPKEDPEIPQKEGTLDAFAPEDVKYDEHLNIKFDDLAIKLPEIKLPDDILSYSRQNSPYSDDDYKKQTKADVPSYKPSYYYNQNDKEETRERKDKNDHRNSDDESDDDDDHAPDTGYYGYYDNSKRKQNYKNKNADEEEEASDEGEENEDLYEKFVRERFGKRGTFEKRSEKLQQAAPLNPDLYKTIKQILKKTADIDEQAKKSGDPNAGYMWTLEYGEKL
ncbi:dentin sialophosphoprotein-like [Spodoptera litura]|uniref:Dentin sialophosphoprotein-like n=1 Tax=Spodoptera litura TaxID=69820 RepID=A0A9J7IWU6_SPOLT|nr:dentin sialophosphoprotein-like [Spodoptera litura]